MNAFKTILVVLDHSRRDQHVLAKAAALSRQTGATVELFLCDAEHEYAIRHNYDARGTAEGRSSCVADAMSYLGSVGASLPFEWAHVTTSACCESPLYQGILHKARRLQPDLLIKSPDCDRSDCQLSFSDTDWQLAGLCPAPILFVGLREWGSTLRVAAAVDVSASERPLATAIVEAARSLRDGVQGQLDVICCVPRENQQGESGRRLNELLPPCSVESERVLLKGEPESVLPGYVAAHGYDVLVMGALAHRAGLTPAVGSLTSKLIALLDCDFLLIKDDASRATTEARFIDTPRLDTP